MICDLHYPAPSQMIDGTEKPKIPLKFAKHAALYNELAVKTFDLNLIFTCNICLSLMKKLRGK